MGKGSDNPFPSILAVESTVPTSPAAGDQRLYIDSADHKLKRVNSSGTVTTVEGTTAPVELGYVQVTANQTGISATVATDLTSLTLTVTVGTRAIIVEVGGWQFDSGSVAGGISMIYLIDVTASAQIAQATLPTGDGGAAAPNCKIRVAPSAGSRTYKAQGRGDTLTAARLLASSTQPAWLRIYEV